MGMPMPNKNTLARRAIALLTLEPLVFCAENQIWAVSILRMLHELEELYLMLPEQRRTCPDCSGKGTRTCDECGHQTDCRSCGGSGKLEVEYNEDDWIDFEHLVKHLAKMRAEVEALGLITAA